MRTIWKYRLELPQTTVTMPANAIFCHFAAQHGWLCAWFELEDGSGRVVEGQRRSFLLHGTGHPISAHEVYLGTLIDGEFVWHLYEATV